MQTMINKSGRFLLVAMLAIVLLSCVQSAAAEDYTLPPGAGQFVSANQRADMFAWAQETNQGDTDLQKVMTTPAGAVWYSEHCKNAHFCEYRRHIVAGCHLQGHIVCYGPRDFSFGYVTSVHRVYWYTQ